MTMADLLAKEDKKNYNIQRGQEIEGEVVSITNSEIILDLGTKSEGVLQTRDLSPEQAANLKVGDKLVTFVLQTDNEAGQIILGLQKAIGKNPQVSQRFKKFQDAMTKDSVIQGTVLELNKGGLIVEVDGIRGFLPTSQVLLTHASNLDELIGKKIDVTVIEVEPNQARLIFSQKAKLTDATKENLSKLKVGSDVSGKIAAVLPFGIFVTLDNGVEGLVHVSEISWEKIEDLASIYKVGDEVKAKVVSTETNTARVNLSIKQLSKDPFSEKVKDLQPDDILKGEITRVTTQGTFITLEGGLEGFLASNKIDNPEDFEVGKSANFLVDTIDKTKRRVNLSPFVTSTADLIYK